MQRRRHIDRFLQPGQWTVCTNPTSIKTIVGSCVAVCLWDPIKRIGGLNHFLLPRPGPRDGPDPRFGSVATPLLIERMSRSGARLRNLRAVVIGGGHPVDTLKSATIGDDNTEIALACLRAAGIRVARQETGGAHGRKLLFETGTGELLIRNVRGWQDRMQEVSTR